MKQLERIKQGKGKQKKVRIETLFTSQFKLSIPDTVYVHTDSGNIVCCDVRIAPRYLKKEVRRT